MPIKIGVVYIYACKHCEKKTSDVNERVAIMETETCENKGEPKFEFKVDDQVVLHLQNNRKSSYHQGVVTGTRIESGTHAPLYEVLIDGAYKTSVRRYEIVKKGNVGEMIAGKFELLSGVRSGQ